MPDHTSIPSRRGPVNKRTGSVPRTIRCQQRQPSRDPLTSARASTRRRPGAPAAHPGRPPRRRAVGRPRRDRGADRPLAAAGAQRRRLVPAARAPAGHHPPRRPRRRRAGRAAARVPHARRLPRHQRGRVVRRRRHLRALHVPRPPARRARRRAPPRRPHRGRDRRGPPRFDADLARLAERAALDADAAHEAADWIDHALPTLPNPSQRRAVELTRDGWTTDEIAAELETSAANVHQLRSRAFAQLRKDRP